MGKWITNSCNNKILVINMNRLYYLTSNGEYNKTKRYRIIHNGVKKYLVINPNFLPINLTDYEYSLNNTIAILSKYIGDDEIIKTPGGRYR